MPKTDEKDKKPTPEDKARDEYNQRINDLKEIVGMRGGEGKRFLRWVMGEAGIYRSAYKGNAETNFKLGKQALGLKILDDLQFAASTKQKAEILL